MTCLAEDHFRLSFDDLFGFFNGVVERSATDGFFEDAPAACDAAGTDLPEQELLLDGAVDGPEGEGELVEPHPAGDRVEGVASHS